MLRGALTTIRALSQGFYKSKFSVLNSCLRQGKIYKIGRRKISMRGPKYSNSLSTTSQMRVGGLRS